MILNKTIICSEIVQRNEIMLISIDWFVSMDIWFSSRCFCHWHSFRSSIVFFYFRYLHDFPNRCHSIANNFSTIINRPMFNSFSIKISAFINKLDRLRNLFVCSIFPFFVKFFFLRKRIKKAKNISIKFKQMFMYSRKNLSSHQTCRMFSSIRLSLRCVLCIICLCSNIVLRCFLAENNATCDKHN